MYGLITKRQIQKSSELLFRYSNGKKSYDQLGHFNGRPGLVSRHFIIKVFKSSMKGPVFRCHSKTWRFLNHISSHHSNTEGIQNPDMSGFQIIKKRRLDPDHLKTGLLDSLDNFHKKICLYCIKWSRLAAILNYPDWFQIVRTIAIAPNHSKSNLQNVPFSNDSGLWIPTVRISLAS